MESWRISGITPQAFKKKKVDSSLQRGSLKEDPYTLEPIGCSQNSVSFGSRIYYSTYYLGVPKWDPDVRNQPYTAGSGVQCDACRNFLDFGLSLGFRA